MTIFNYAAIKVQQLMRGVLVRKHGSLRNYIEWKRASKSNHNNNNNKPDGAAAAAAATATSSSRQLEKYLRYSDRSKEPQKQVGRGGVVQFKLASTPGWLSGGYSVWCAVRIQSWWRMVPKRRRAPYRRRVVFQIAALVIQSAWRSLVNSRIHEHVNPVLVALRLHLSKPDGRQRASVMIQLSWRAHCNRRIYRYFRDLVMYKLQGAPADILKTIIPNETDLLDKAAGVIARFRLGGTVFPPKVYFKIFTHRPLCDVNAFAPRAYCMEKPAADEATPFLTNVRSKKVMRVGAKYFGAVVSTTSNMESWYKREERNPWRPLSSQLFDEILTPPWLKEAPHLKKASPFHFSSMKRKEELMRERKRRKREWMLKAYVLAASKVDSGAPPLNLRPPSGYGMAALQQQQHQQMMSPSGYYSYEPETDDGRRDESGRGRGGGGGKGGNNVILSVSVPHRGGGGLAAARLVGGGGGGGGGNYSSKEGRRDSRPETLTDSIASGASTPMLVGNVGAEDMSQNRARSQQPHAHARQQRQQQQPPEHDDLVDWSLALDFDDYTSDWAKIGTSMPSDCDSAKMYSVAAGLSQIALSSSSNHNKYF